MPNPVGRPRKPLEMTIDTDRQRYVITHKTTTTWLTWQYCYNKALALHRELTALGYALEMPKASNLGTLAGYEDMIHISEEAKAHWQLTGQAFVCMLHPQFSGLEGCRVWADGREFWVARQGNYAPVHQMRRHKDSRNGPKIPDIMFKEINVLEYPPK